MGPNLWSNWMLRQNPTYGTKYHDRQIVHKTTRTDINSRKLKAAVIVRLYFRNIKSTRNTSNEFLKYKISICLDHTYMYIVLRVPCTCNFTAIYSIICRVSIVEATKYQNKDANRFAVLTDIWFTSRLEAIQKISHLRLDRENISEIDGLELLGEKLTNIYLQQVSSSQKFIFNIKVTYTFNR